jgi:phosphate starvation-inducible PhoH-like protein
MPRAKAAKTKPAEPTIEIPRRITLSSFQQVAWKTVDENSISILAGEAGCGKTFLAMHYGIESIKAKRFSELVVIRSPLEAGRSRLGFLPGAATAAEKLAPWCAPILAIAKQLQFGSAITFLPTCYIQGMTFTDAFVIVDECQNLDLEEFEAVTTRLGKGSKICLTGDAHQDTRKMNGMRPYMEATKGIESIGHYAFPDEANQRHPIIREVTRALRAYREKH